MKYRIIVILILVFTVAGSTMQAQKYITKNANIRFYSDAPAEKIEAINNQVNCALDASTGDLANMAQCTLETGYIPDGTALPKINTPFIKDCLAVHLAPTHLFRFCQYTKFNRLTNLHKAD